MRQRTFWNVVASLSAVLVLTVGTWFALSCRAEPSTKAVPVKTKFVVYEMPDGSSRQVGEPRHKLRAEAKRLALARADLVGTVAVAAVNGASSLLISTITPFWIGTRASSGALSIAVVGTYSANVAFDCNPEVTIGRIVAALDSTVDWRTIDAIALSASFSCTYSGVGGQFDVTTNDGLIENLGYAVFSPSASMMVAQHEFGHSLGFPHAYGLACPTMPLGGTETCAFTGGVGSSYGFVDYGDAYSVMARATGGGLTARERDWAGWLPGGALAAVTAPGSYVLSDINVGAGLRALRIPRAAAGSLYVEYRQGVGVLLHTNLDLGAAFDAANSIWFKPILTVGAAYVDPATGATVRHVSDSGSTATVEVDPGVPDLTPPTCTSTAPAMGSAPFSGLVTQAATFSDANPYRARFRVISNSGVSIFDRNVFAPPWETAWDSASAPDGSYYSLKIVYDAAGNKGFCGAYYFNTANAGVATAIPTATSTRAATATPTVSAPTRTPTGRPATPTRTPTKCRPRWKCR